MYSIEKNNVNRIWDVNEIVNLQNLLITLTIQYR